MSFVKVELVITFFFQGKMVHYIMYSVFPSLYLTNFASSSHVIIAMAYSFFLFINHGCPTYYTKCLSIIQVTWLELPFHNNTTCMVVYVELLVAFCPYFLSQHFVCLCCHWVPPVSTCMLVIKTNVHSNFLSYLMKFPSWGWNNMKSWENAMIFVK